MGIIKAVTSAISGGLADQWLEAIEAADMGDKTVFTTGVKIRRGQNVKGTDNLVSNGSVIHVKDNQFMMLVDGGKVVDYTAEAGYYTVKSSASPSPTTRLKKSLPSATPLLTSKQTNKNPSPIPDAEQASVRELKTHYFKWN